MTTETLTLTDFLLARIAEDEVVIRSHVAAIDLHHLPRFDAGRMVAECEAKRRIIERYAHLLEWGNSGDAAWILPLLALPYADHPDYHGEWRP